MAHGFFVEFQKREFSSVQILVYADTLKLMMDMCLIIYYLQGDAPRSYKLVSL